MKPMQSAECGYRRRPKAFVAPSILCSLVIVSQASPGYAQQATTPVPGPVTGPATPDPAAPAPMTTPPAIPAAAEPSAATVQTAPAGAGANTPATSAVAPAAIVPEPTTAATQPTAMPVVEPPAEDEAYKKINMNIWLRIAGVAQNPVNRNRIDRLSTNAEVEAHFSNRMRKWLQWTANFVGTYGNGSVDGAGQFALLDLIAQLEPDEAFNVWFGRMLVPSDRSNFSGPYFMAPWNYPGAFGAGPRQGPFGRNDGATIWGQFGGGTFKYYAGAYNLYGAARGNGQFTAPLISGRLNLSLLNPEPGFYHSSTYYGKDILAIGIGGQYQKNGTGDGNPDPALVTTADYGLFNADVLFEKTLGGAGVVDIEGALYKYVGDNETQNLSYFALASYLTPNVEGIGKFQPLVRIQQTKYKSIGGVEPDTATAVDAQVGYVIDTYATRFALGFQHAKLSSGAIGNQVFAGIQLMK